MFNVPQQHQQLILHTVQNSSTRTDLSYPQNGPNDKYVEVWVPSKNQYVLKPLSALQPGEFFQLPEHRAQMIANARCFQCRVKPKVQPYLDRNPDIIIEGIEVVVAPPEFINDIKATPSGEQGVELLIPIDNKPKLGLASKLNDVEDLPLKERHGT